MPLHDIAAGAAGGFFPLPGIAGPYSPFLPTVSASMAANEAMGIRVAIAETGTLRDFAVYVSGSAGNIDGGIYSTDATRSLLWSTGSIACPAVGAWRILGDPQLACAAGDQFDFAIAASSASFTGSRVTMVNPAHSRLPAGYLPTVGGADSFIAWRVTTSFPLPSTITEGSMSTNNAPVLLLCRIS